MSFSCFLSENNKWCNCKINCQLFVPHLHQMINLKFCFSTRILSECTNTSKQFSIHEPLRVLTSRLVLRRKSLKSIFKGFDPELPQTHTNTARTFLCILSESKKWPFLSILQKVFFLRESFDRMREH